MKHDYIGDIGDFANNGLLRFLCGMTGPPTDNPLQLGVVWYLNDNEREGSTGNEIGYLNHSAHNEEMYQVCDPDLYRAEQVIVAQSMLCQQQRNIKQTMRFRILPRNTPDFPDSVPYNNIILRRQWIQNALGVMEQDTDILFLNPDNGIELAPGTELKNVHLWEIGEFFENHKSLIIYNHLGQGLGTHAERIYNIATRLIDELNPTALWVVKWNRVSTRAYFMMAQSHDHRDRIEERLQLFQSSHWCNLRPWRQDYPHFTLDYGVYARDR